MIYSETPTRKDAIIALSRELHHEGCTIRGDGSDINKITLESGEALKFSSDDIDAKLIEIIAEYDAQEYARNRAIEYPSIQDVTVALAEKAEGDSTMWDEITAKRAAVKAKYSKP